MRLGLCNPGMLAEYRRRAFSQFCPEVLPLVVELPTCFFELNAESPTRDFGAVELVAPSLGFLHDTVKECGDSADRLRVGTKSDELRMILISASAAPQNLLGQ